MREESHLDDMRAAIRGDFERLAERRSEEVVLRVRELPEPAIDARADLEDDGAVAGSRPKRSWIDRLLGL